MLQKIQFLKNVSEMKISHIRRGWSQMPILCQGGFSLCEAPIEWKEFVFFNYFLKLESNSVMLGHKHCASFAKNVCSESLFNGGLYIVFNSRLHLSLPSFIPIMDEPGLRQPWTHWLYHCHQLIVIHHWW